jgi:hypothetical protein
MSERTKTDDAAFREWRANQKSDTVTQGLADAGGFLGRVLVVIAAIGCVYGLWYGDQQVQTACGFTGVIAPLLWLALRK